MKLTVHTRSAGRKAFLENAAKFFANELNISKLNFDLNVYSIRGLKEKGSRGVATIVSAKRGHKELAVYLDSRLDTDKLISTFAHEMVHIKQMARGQYWSFVDDYGHPQRYWMGKEVDENYFDQPWEIEAWTKERLLSVKLERIIYDFHVWKE